MALVTAPRSVALLRPLARSNSSAAADKHVYPGAYSHRDSMGTPYTKQQRNQNRPVSPCIFPLSGPSGGMLYAWPPAALSSITNRFTGGALSLGMLGMGSGASGIAPLAKFSVAFPLSYHYVVGIRHLVWDNKPELLTNEEVTKTSYAVLGVSVGVSAIAALM